MIIDHMKRGELDDLLAHLAPSSMSAIVKLALDIDGHDLTGVFEQGGHRTASPLPLSRGNACQQMRSVIQDRPSHAWLSGGLWLKSNRASRRVVLVAEQQVIRGCRLRFLLSGQDHERRPFVMIDRSDHERADKRTKELRCLARSGLTRLTAWAAPRASRACPASNARGVAHAVKRPSLTAATQRKRRNHG